ncbi:DUF4126 domain-containing protein [Nocardia sp. CDC159]|uniref:DUF4126 domain-containing protein n=1 Tax=Nocardia pulmonis TaxID=2951408 RepID=A0A9X2E5C2_9NOCA|nr:MULTISPECIES: DUF4126 domain-containing protein [Nocardia]MCM6774612.1 DUF4126 domain-containing protein [Nocardia pulmonis]MCM6787323.1 DUF4126 domain-containing protein [Nocardia sp. CDC159]
MEISSAVGAVLGAFGLSGAAGLNAWLPLLVVGVADRLGWVDLGGSYGWLSSTPALIGVGVLFLLDLVGDKIPAVDSVLHGIGTLVAPVSGAILFTAEAGMSANLSPVAAAVLGAVTAGGVHAGRAVARPFVTGTTAGVGNPVVSTAEDGTSLVLTILALAVPVVAFVAVLVLLAGLGWLALRAGRWLRGRRRRGELEPGGAR